jgi:predicted amidohydrolase YtcJ
MATRGRLDFPVDTIRAILRECVARGIQPQLHVVGDTTVAVVLALMADVAPDSVWHRLRPRFEHGEGLTADLIPLARRLGVTVVQNPSHFALDAMATARWGAERKARQQLFKSLLAAGIPIAIGSDGPQSPGLNLFLALSHPDNPAEALTIEQAVTAYTRGSAYAELAEHDKGTLAVGMLADLAVLSQDIFTVPPTALPATRSELTMVGGRVVHEK